MENQISQISQNVSNTLTSIKDSLNNTFNQYSSQNNSGTQNASLFNYSNTIIAKFSFLIVVIIVFMFLVNLGIMLISYFSGPSNNPYLIQGMIDGTYGVIIPQDPMNNNSVTLLRSNNQSKGAEFTWCVWLYINDLNDNKKFQHIFNKGDNNYDRNTNKATTNNAPGLYLGPSNNKLTVVMDTVVSNDTNNVIEIDNIPIRKWVNVCIRLENKILDVYVNGTMTRRLVLQNVPKQNYNNVYVCQNGGFAGKLSDLRYFNYALNVFEINRILYAGPNTNTNKLTLDQKAVKQGGFSYLSNLWYYNTNLF